MAKQPEKRYVSAGAMADDLASFIDGRPILARRVSAVEKAMIWTKRNPVLSGLTALLTLVLVGTAIGSTLAAFKFREMAKEQTRLTNSANQSATLASEKATEAENEAKEKERLLYYSDMRLAVDSMQQAGGIGAARSLIEKWNSGQRDHRGWEWHWLKAATSSEAKVFKGGGFIDIQFSPDEKLLAFSEGFSVHIVDMKTMQKIRTLRLKGVPRELEFSYDSRFLAIVTRVQHRVSVCEIQTGEMVYESNQFNCEIRQIHWAPNDRQVVFLGPENEKSKPRKCVRVLDTKTWKEEVLPALDVQLEASDLSPNGERMVTQDYKNRNIVVLKSGDWSAGAMRKNESIHAEYFCWNPINDTFAIAAGSQGVQIWNEQAEKLLALNRNQLEYFLCAAWHPAGRYLAAVSREHDVTVWDVETKKLAAELRGNVENAKSVDWSPSGRYIASTTHRAVRVWDLRQSVAYNEIPVHHVGERTELRWHSDQGLFVNHFERVSSVANPKRITDVLASTKKTNQVDEKLYAVSPSNRFWAGVKDEIIEIHQFDDDKNVVDVFDGQLKLKERVDGDGNQMRRVMDLVFNPTNPKQLMFVSTRFKDEEVVEKGSPYVHKRGIYLWDIGRKERPKLIAKIRRFYPSAVWDPTGTKVAVSDEQSTVVVDAADRCGEILWETPNQTRATHAVCFSPDGKHVLRVGKDCQVIVFDAKDGRRLRSFVGHRLQIRDVKWAADGSRIATASDDGTVRVWDFETGETTFMFKQDHPVYSVAWHPDGKRLAAVFSDGKVRIWDSRLGYED